MGTVRRPRVGEEVVGPTRQAVAHHHRPEVAGVPLGAEDQAAPISDLQPSVDRAGRPLDLDGHVALLHRPLK